MLKGSHVQWLVAIAVWAVMIWIVLQIVSNENITLMFYSPYFFATTCHSTVLNQLGKGDNGLGCKHKKRLNSCLGNMYICCRLRTITLLWRWITCGQYKMNTNKIKGTMSHNRNWWKIGGRRMHKYKKMVCGGEWLLFLVLLCMDTIFVHEVHHIKNEK